MLTSELEEQTSGKSLQSCSPHPEKEAIFRNDKRQFTLVVQQVWSHSAASNFAPLYKTQYIELLSCRHLVLKI